MLHRVSTVFGNLLSAETDDDLQELAKEIMPMMSEHENNISLNEELFARIKAVYEQQDKETLQPGTAQAAGRHLQRLCTQRCQPPGRSQGEIPGFMQRAQPADAAVQRKQPERNERLQACHHRQVTTGRATRERGRSRCRDSREKGVEGWVFTLQAPSYGPFLTYADSRDLRRELYMAYNTKCTHDNASNNLEIVKKLANAVWRLPNS